MLKRKEGYSASEVLPWIGSQEIYGQEKAEKDWDGDVIKMSSVRLRTFKEKGCKCACCGIEGTVFFKERHIKNDRWYFNLYAEVDGDYVLMTRDHIVPKSRGGKNGISNMQTMCTVCNAEKAAKTPEHWDTHLLAKELHMALIEIRKHGENNPGCGYTAGKLAGKVLEKNREKFEKLGLTYFLNKA
jgi:hypothetical protein